MGKGRGKRERGVELEKGVGEQLDRQEKRKMGKQK